MAERDGSDVADEVTAVKERYDKLKKTVDEKLNKGLKVNEAFDEVRKIQAKQAKVCGDVGRVLDYMEPVGNDREKAEAQEETINVRISLFFLRLSLHEVLIPT